MATCNDPFDDNTLVNPLPEMRPIPKLSLEEDVSDEESFVVLSKSLDSEKHSWFSFDKARTQSIIDAVERELDEEIAVANAKLSKLKPTVEDHFQPPVETTPESLNLNIAECSVEEIQQKIASLVEENQCLKQALHDNNVSMKIYYERIVAWQDNVQKTYQTHKDKFEDAKKYINVLKSEIARLKGTESQENENNDKIEEALDSNDTKHLEDEVASLKKSFEDLKVKSDLEDQVIDLKKSLEEMEIQNKKLECQNAKLNAAYVKSLKQHSDKQAAGFEEELRNVRLQLMQAQQKITEFEHTKTVVNEQINIKDEEILKLKKSLEGSKFADEDMYVLQEQLGLYKADFETEKNAKEMIREEKNQLVEDIHNLQERNRKLREELDTLRGGPHFRASPNARAPQEIPRRKYECPKCQFAFFNYQALENHVHRCLDMAEMLP